ncbi:ATP-dependent DNA ligase [Catellatospora methionotrophica]|uniref:ATP-dependent DNA ligase n=1 Tax=Catellatospora methionotrophica TaxID=121620 RepID=UPI0033CF3566
MAAAPVAAWPAGPGLVAEPKWDGWRLALFRLPGGVVLQGRSGRDLTRYFPEIADAGMGLPVGTVLDGEVVVWAGGRTDFSLLQRRIARPVPDPPAHLVVFDILEDPGAGVVVALPLLRRRELLERLLGAYPDPQLVLCPQSSTAAGAADWMQWGAAAGIEGVVVKAAAGAYRFGRRDWAKFRSRHPVDLVVGGVTGSLSRPGSLLLGELVGARLVFRARTGPLAARDRAELGQLLPMLAGGGRGWPNPLPGRWVNLTSQEPMPYQQVEPVLTVEVDVDAAFDRAVGRWRHPVRYRRIRADLLPMQLDRIFGHDWKVPPDSE